MFYAWTNSIPFYITIHGEVRFAIDFILVWGSSEFLGFICWITVVLTIAIGIDTAKQHLQPCNFTKHVLIYIEREEYITLKTSDNRLKIYRDHEQYVIVN